MTLWQFLISVSLLAYIDSDTQSLKWNKISAGMRTVDVLVADLILCIKYTFLINISQKK